MNDKNLHLRPVIEIDREKCCNCHRCIAVCPVKICNDGSGDFVSINHDLCIGCGECIEACSHGARRGLDDIDAFFADVKAGVPIVAVEGPAGTTMMCVSMPKTLSCSMAILLALVLLHKKGHFTSAVLPCRCRW